MGHTRQQWEDRIRARLGDLGVVQAVPATRIPFALETAFAVVSTDRPYELVATLTGNGALYDLTLTSWEDRWSRIIRVEYPAGEKEPVYLEARDYLVLPGTTTFRLRSAVPTATETAKITYGARWPTPTDTASVDKIPTARFVTTPGGLFAWYDDPDRCARCGSARIERDPDVLDTWFSAGLWPFSTLGWPEATDDLRTFYPTTIMETGYDILFFWVARMVMMGLEFTGRLPFETVYLHGLIRDEQGRKMSKTLGNVIDPLEVMDEFGADALRLTLLTGSTPGNDMNLSAPRVQANRNFANKIWNAGRLVIGAVERLPRGSAPASSPTLADRWVLARRSQLLRNVDRLFESHQYGEAGRQIYEFFWGEFADWYLEAAKLQAAEGTSGARSTVEIMVAVLDTCLRLLHPYTPFVTEELWQRLRDACQAHPSWLTPPAGWGEALVVAPWPTGGSEADDDEAIRRFELLREVIRTVRNARAEKHIDPGRRLGAVVGAGTELAWLREQAPLLCLFARLEADEVSLQERIETPPPGSLPLTAGGVEIYLKLAEAFDARAEGERVARQLETLERQVGRLQSLLAGPFADRAPAEIVGAEREKLRQAEEEAGRLRAQLQGLKDG